jgi:arabinogalactan endo-1,4-beta-galactosidase
MLQIQIYRMMKNRIIILMFGMLTMSVMAMAQGKFVLGADVSYLTEMEDKGAKFYNMNDQQQECMSIIKDLGCQAIRLRVWVKPENNYCGLEDVVVKAKRAAALGMKLMIDFHYSDTWADPGQQNRPATWKDYTVDQLCIAVAQHTKVVLKRLKDEGLDVTWVQVGNETTDGMFYPTGQLSKGGSAKYARFFNAGAKAAKAVFPQCITILHISTGDNNGTSQWSLDAVKNAGAVWDMIGLSLYFNWTDNVTAENKWETVEAKCVSNVTALINRYDTPVMIAEVGMNHWDKQDKNILAKLRKDLEVIDRCAGAFYWEPEQYSGWDGNGNGAFVVGNKPSSYLADFYKPSGSGIENITVQKHDNINDAIYTISGQRVTNSSSLAPGIYIRNGKKFIKK